VARLWDSLRLHERREALHRGGTGHPQLLYKAAVKTWDSLPPDVKAKLNLTNPLTLYKSLQHLLKERGYADDIIEALNSANVIY